MEYSRDFLTFRWMWRWMRKGLPPHKAEQLRNWFAKPTSLVFSRNLPALARIYKTDKWDSHWYAQHYQTHFASLRHKPIILLEIGIGGYADASAGGGSLRMWRRFFPKGKIYGIDICDKSAHNANRIQTFRGNQTDEDFLKRVITEIGKPDIIIDDGSHVNSHVIKTFEILFPLLKDDGIYAVEDTQTAYWPEYGGSSDDLDKNSTSMRLLKGLVDGLNHAEFIHPGYVPSYCDRHVVSLHFYHNLVLVHKGQNDEKSNIIRNTESST